MQYFPAHLNMKGSLCLLVGGGEIALRKGFLLVEAGAVLRVIAKRVDQGLRTLVEDNHGEFFERAFEEQDLDDPSIKLVIAATDNDAVNQQVSKAANVRHMLINAVDSPAISNFIVPAIVDRDPLVISISSAGRSPVLARLLRTKLESEIPDQYGKLAGLLGQFRGRVKEVFDSVEKRRRFWEEVLAGPLLELALSRQFERAKAWLHERLDQEAESSDDKASRGALLGEVYLVGAGPGDPDLLTFKAVRLMQKADVVLYDRLVSPGVLNMVRRDADRIYVGKARDQHTLPQKEINESLVTLAKQGRRVCRLKGGDPFIFGRGGEEIDLLAQNRIPFQVVPGITAASGCASYSGIPLTHRDHAQSVRFVTGHLKDGSPDLDWSSLITERETLVIYMGLLGLRVLCENLIRHGMDERRPIALVQQGTTGQHKVVTGELCSFADKIESMTIRAPTLIIVGEVVTLREQLNWYD